MKNIPLFVFIFFIISIKATTYYVDSSNGNDANDGISPDTAWQSITKLNNQSFMPGDSILFKRNEIFRGKLLLQNSGTSDHWIVFSAYGSGENPQLLGSEQVSNWVHYSGSVYKKSNLDLPSYAGDGVFEFDDYNQNPIRLTKDINIPNLPGYYYYDENLDNGTLYIYCSDGLAPDTHNIELSMYSEIISVDYHSYIEFSNLSLKFGNCKNATLYSVDYINMLNINSSFNGGYGNPNIFFLGGEYITIEDCVLYDSWNSGITFYPIGTTRPGHHNIVRRCTITKVLYNDGIGIHADSSGNPPGDYHIVEDNTISECGEGSIDVAGDYHVIRNNICFNNVEDGIQIGASGDHMLIENNTCYGNARHGIISFGHTDEGSTGGNIIRNNIIYDNVKYGLMSGYQPIAIYNNTICNSQTRNELYFGYQDIPTDLKYKNNIIYNDTNTSTVRFDNGSPSDAIMDNNNYNVVSGDELIFNIIQDNQHYTLDEIKTTYNQELNSFVANPVFVDAQNKDYHLQSTSPCIDSGGFLTQTTSTGSGTAIPVENISYFCDGYGIVSGDIIQLQGQSQALEIINIDRVNSTITVNESVSWNLGDGVALSYNGTAPDIGAYESINSAGDIEKTLSKNIKVFPNPTNDMIFFSNDLTNSYYQILSLSGRIVQKGFIKENKISLNKLPKAIYILEVFDNAMHKRLMSKFIKK